MKKRLINNKITALICCLLLLGTSIPYMSAEGETVEIDSSYTLAADSGELQLFYNAITGDIAVATEGGHVWYSAVQPETLDLDAITESQKNLLITPLTVEYTLLNSRSDKSEKHAIKEMDLTVTAEKVKDGVKLTYKAASVALEIDLVLTVDGDSFTAEVPEDGIREGVGLEERLDKSMSTIRQNIEYIYSTIDQMQADSALSRHQSAIANYRASFDEYVEHIESITSVVDIEYEIQLATTLMEETQTIFKGGVGVEGVFNGIARDDSLSEETKSTYSRMLKDVDTKFTQTKLLSQQLGTIKYGAVTNLSILPNFGALGDRDTGYVLYPDGSGAITYATEEHPAYQHFFQKDLYSEDVPDIYGNLLEDSTGAEKVLMPIFGVKNGDNAFLAVISDGAEHAAVEFYPSGLDVNVNRIDARMRCRRTATAYANGQSRGSKYELDRFVTSYGVTYLFISGSQANYSGMANRYRDYLLDHGQLNKSPLIEKSPTVALNMIMGVRRQQLLGSKFQAMTTFEQAAQILQYCQENGTEEILVNLAGWTKDGYAPWTVSDGKPASQLGGERGLKALTAYTAEMGIPLFLQENYVLSSKGSNLFKQNEYAVDNTSMLISSMWDDMYLLNPFRALEYLLNRIFPKRSSYGTQGITFEHMGHFLYYDYNARNPATRKDTAETWNEMLQSSQEQLGYAAVEEAGAFAFGQVDWVTQVPDEASMYIFTDESVPFYQLVVHGYLLYTGKSFNKFYDKQYEKMKALEYGYIPVYDLTWDKTELLKNTACEEIFSSQFEDWKEEIVQVSSEFAALGDLATKPIISHERVNDQVVKVRYEGGGKLLLNYGAEAVEVDGVMVEAMNYQIIR